MANKLLFQGKRVRRQVQYFQPGQEEITQLGDDDDYNGEDGPNAGSDNEYLGAPSFNTPLTYLCLFDKIPRWVIINKTLVHKRCSFHFA